MQNLITRTITGAIFVALIIGSLIAHPLAFTGVIYVIMLICLLEFFRLANNNGILPQKVTILLTGSVVYIIPSLVALKLVSPLFLAFLMIQGLQILIMKPPPISRLGSTQGEFDPQPVQF